MKIFMLLFALSLSLGSFETCHATVRSSSSSEGGHLVGDFLILAFAKHDSFVLTNNVTYEPAKDHYAKQSKDWELRDPIRVLSTGDSKKFILINMRLGETIKTKVLDLGD
jgi:hypothetical protein